MSIRLFVALDPPQGARQELSALCCGLPGARWTPMEQLHLTLCFIGETDGTTFLDIRDALQEVRAPACTLALQGLGFFPPRREPRVLWAGVRADNALTLTQQRILTRLRRCGVQPETRKFTPHITLARLQEEARPRLQRYLQAHALFSGSPFTVRHFTLYSSVLGRSGATHLPEAEYALQCPTEGV